MVAWPGAGPTRQSAAMSNRNGGMRVSYAAAVKNFSDIEQQAASSRSIFPAVYFLPPVEAILRINSRSVGSTSGVTTSSPSVRPAGGSGFFPAIASAGPADPGDARHKPSTFYRWYDRFGSDGPETKRLCIWLKTKCVHDVANSSRTGMFFPLRDQSAI